MKLLCALAVGVFINVAYYCRYTQTGPLHSVMSVLGPFAVGVVVGVAFFWKEGN